MIQRTFDIFNEAEFSWILSSLKDARLYGSQGRVFMQLCFSRFTSVEAQKILDYIHSELPHIQVVGMSLYGDALVHLNTTKMLRVNISEFSESEVRIFEYDAHEMNEDEICSKFRAQLASILDAKGVMVLASGLTFNISRFMENVTQGYEEIPFFGTQANLNTADTEFLKPFVATTRLISAGIVVTVFSGANLYFHVKSVFGWKPIGMPLAVETSEVPCGIGDTLITRIAGKPAADIYRQYLNVRPDRYFISNICEFPLALERNGMIMARVPCGVTKNGELNAMGNIKNGETVRFTYGKTDEILRQSWEASAEMAQFYPQGMFLYVCANRAIFMKDRAHEEIEYFGKIVPGTVYCHGFSELFRYKGQGGVFNSTLIAVGVREGEAHVDSPDISRLPQGLFKSPEWNEAHTTAKEANTEAAENSCDSFSPDSVERHSMFESPIGVSIPIADRLVTFLEAVTEELRNATVAANAASDAKSAFLSSMSHEIRSPINAVLGLDEMILRESTEPQIKGYARDIQSSGRSLLSIINDILDFSKIEAGKMEIINDDYDLRSVITDLANMVERRAVSKGLEFIVNVDSQMPHLLHGDETRIKQCALNILTNAVKYTPTGSVTLTVGCIKKSDDVIDLSFSVKDTGIGIKEADLEKLYKPFERIEENRNRSIEGTGLGMSIVNGLLAEMGSHLVVKSTYGKGSEFSFTIEQRVCSWERIGTHEEAKAALMRAAGTYSESFQAPDARILVVDDTPVNLTVVRGLLKNTRIQIDTAQSGAEALVLVRKTEYNIMFIDHLMPGMNGIEFLAANFTDSESINKNTPAIALTANAVSGAKELYIQAGFDNYLSKPIDSKKFEEMIVSYLPKELVLLPGDKNFVQHTSGGWNGVERRAASGADPVFIALFGLDSAAALKNCGTVDVLVQAIRDFYEAIEEKSAQLEDFASSDDWKNFTILVHALKSSARLIGATALSDAAKALEECGNRAQTGDKDAERTIRQKTPALLCDYRAYSARLAPLCGDVGAGAGSAKNAGALAGAGSALMADASATSSASGAATAPGAKPLLPHKKMTEALSALKEVVSAFDFDMADAIIAELSDYALSARDDALFTKLKKAVKAADAACVMDLLKETI